MPVLPAESPVPLAESPGLVLELLAVSLVLPAESPVPLAESLGLALELPAVSLVPLAVSLVLPAEFPVPGLHILQGVSGAAGWVA